MEVRGVDEAAPNRLTSATGAFPRLNGLRRCAEMARDRSFMGFRVDDEKAQATRSMIPTMTWLHSCDPIHHEEIVSGAW